MWRRRISSNAPASSSGLNAKRFRGTQVLLGQ